MAGKQNQCEMTEEMRESLKDSLVEMVATFNILVERFNFREDVLIGALLEAASMVGSDEVDLFCETYHAMKKEFPVNTAHSVAALLVSAARTTFWLNFGSKLSSALK